MLNIPLELGRLPYVTRVVCGMATGLSIIFWILEYRSYLQFSPASGNDKSQLGPSEPVVPLLALIPFSSLYYPWTFITASFISSNIFTLGISLATLLLGGRYIEHSYSSSALIRFYAVVVLVPNAIIYISLLILWAITRNRAWLYSDIHGSMALQAGILVAFKQLVPEHTVTLYKNIVKMRVKHFPSLFLLSTILSAPILGNYSSIILGILGFLSSWIYLRFYKQSLPDLGSQLVSMRGDASETFALSQFFPDVMQAPIDRVSAVTFDALVSIGVCGPFGVDPLDTNEFGHRTAGTGVGRAEAERRRTLALRALDTRLTREPDAPEATQLPPQVNH